MSVRLATTLRNSFYPTLRLYLPPNKLRFMHEEEEPSDKLRLDVLRLCYEERAHLVPEKDEKAEFVRIISLFADSCIPKLSDFVRELLANHEELQYLVECDWFLECADRITSLILIKIYGYMHWVDCVDNPEVDWSVNAHNFDTKIANILEQIIVNIQMEYEAIAEGQLPEDHPVWPEVNSSAFANDDFNIDVFAELMNITMQV
jgi:hypothetical protein